MVRQLLPTLQHVGRLSRRSFPNASLKSSKRYDSSHSHGHEHSASESPDDVYTHDSIFEPKYLAGLAAVAALYFWYSYSLKHAPAFTDNPSSHLETHQTEDGRTYPAAAGDESKPWITRYLAYHMPQDTLESSLAIEMRAVKIARANAADYLTSKTMTRSAVKRLPIEGHFFAHSNANADIPVGSEADLSDLVFSFEPAWPSRPPLEKKEKGEEGEEEGDDE